MRLIRNAAIAVAMTCLLAATLPAQEPARKKELWTVDKPHSMATFRIRHLMSKVTGQFRDFEVNIHIDRADPARSSVDFVIQAASIDTGDASRDEHLRSPDFFEATKYPAITFKSVSVTPKSATLFDVTGTLTMHGVTRSLTLPVTFMGFGKDARGNERAGFEIVTTLDRKDYNITWNRLLDEGGLLLGDEVDVVINLQVMKK